VQGSGIRRIPLKVVLFWIALNNHPEFTDILRPVARVGCEQNNLAGDVYG
jgi:hypothetical protein